MTGLRDPDTHQSTCSKQVAGINKTATRIAKASIRQKVEAPASTVFVNRESLDTFIVVSLRNGVNRKFTKRSATRYARPKSFVDHLKGLDSV